jgi:hypothetical protein
VRLRIRCPACGTEQETPEAGAPDHCEICGTSLTAPPSDPPETLPLVGPTALSKEKPAGPTPPTLEQLLAAPTGSAGKEIDELLDIAKQSISTLSIVPIWGPWQLWQSDAHSEGEKIRLTVLSAAVTLALLIGFLWVLPGEAERTAAAQSRVETDFDALAAMVHRYALDTGAYPDDEVWKRTIQRGDARFIDPWNRTYLYRLEPEAFVLGTYGNDGAADGSGEDADYTRAVPRRRLERDAR